MIAEMIPNYPNSILIRVATPDDLDGLARLNALFNGIATTAAQLGKRLADPRCAEIPLVAIVEGAVVGFAGLRITPHLFYAGSHAELTELFIEEAMRRHGIGAALLRYAEQVARERHAHSLVLQTGEDNDVAQRFYAAMGYERWDITLGRRLEDK